MALRGHVFDKQLFSSDCYALVTDTFLNKNSGIIKGCELTNTASSIYIDNGYFVVKGRPIQEEGGTTIEVEPGSLEGIYCKLVCEIDMSQTNTTTSLNQVSYKILEDTIDYPTLVLEDITDGGTIYQFELAKFRRTLNGIEDFVDTRSFLNFDSIYDFVKNEIKKIEEGSLFITEEEFEEEMLNSGVVVSATEPIGSDRKKVWFKKGKNLFNSSGLSSQTNVGVTTSFNNSTMTVNGTSTGENVVYNQTPTVITLPAGTYIWSLSKKSGTVTRNGQDFAFYLAKRGTTTRLSTIALGSFDATNKKSSSFALTEETKIDLYAFVNNSGMAFDNLVLEVQMEQGSTATEYEEYIEPEIYVLNNNGVYEEFISKEDTLERYSTGETRIGTWIDGKPLYRKTVKINALPNSAQLDIPHNISNLNEIVHVYGKATNTSSATKATISIPFISVSDISNCVNIHINDTVIMISAGSDRSSWSGYAIIEYTKTTD